MKSLSQQKQQILLIFLGLNYTTKVQEARKNFPFSDTFWGDATNDILNHYLLEGLASLSS